MPELHRLGNNVYGITLPQVMFPAKYPFIIQNQKPSLQETWSMQKCH